jgi:excisionase family DNA binding protein
MTTSRSSGRPDAPDRLTRARAREVPRFSLTRLEAATSLGVSVDFFEEHVQPELRLVRRGRLVLVPVQELERWVERNAALTVEAVA